MADGRPRRDRYREIWEAENEGGRRYRAHRETFLNMAQAFEDDPQELRYLWRWYVREMVLGQSGMKRNDPHNPFWQEMGVDPRDFDWDEWRHAMGYDRREQ